MINGDVFEILLAPYVSEKASIVADKHHQFVFKVALGASKPQIKRAVEAMFSVKVAAVQTSILPGKAKRFGRFEGRRGVVKKAYVTLLPGYDINFAGNE